MAKRGLNQGLAASFAPIYDVFLAVQDRSLKLSSIFERLNMISSQSGMSIEMLEMLSESTVTSRLLRIAHYPRYDSEHRKSPTLSKSVRIRSCCATPKSFMKNPMSMHS